MSGHVRGDARKRQDENRGDSWKRARELRDMEIERNMLRATLKDVLARAEAAEADLRILSARLVDRTDEALQDRAKTLAAERRIAEWHAAITALAVEWWKRLPKGAHILPSDSEATLKRCYYELRATYSDTSALDRMLAQAWREGHANVLAYGIEHADPTDNPYAGGDA